MPALRTLLSEARKGKACKVVNGPAVDNLPIQIHVIAVATQCTISDCEPSLKSHDGVTHIFCQEGPRVSGAHEWHPEIDFFLELERAAGLIVRVAGCQGNNVGTRRQRCVHGL